MAGLTDIFGANDDGQSDTTAGSDSTGNDAKVENGPDNPDPRFGTDDSTSDGSDGSDAGAVGSFDDGGF